MLMPIAQKCAAVWDNDMQGDPANDAILRGIGAEIRADDANEPGFGPSHER
jgi:hypothetical protein